MFIDEFIEAKLRLLESIKNSELSKKAAHSHAQIIKILNSEYISPKVRSYFAPEKSAPFTDFEHEPDNITQIKKLLNALYYAWLSFIDIECVEDFRSFDTILIHLPTLLDDTVATAYEAAYLATHLDVDLKEMFQGAYGAQADKVGDLSGSVLH